MGKLQEFVITLKDNKTVYSPGESVSGSVKISTAQAIQCKAIKVNCQGYCGVTNKANDSAWVEEEQYFSSSISVADKGTLKEGEHSFPFKFLLPAIAPTSFEGVYGKIMYRVRAFIDTPRFTKDYKAEKSFYMLNNVDLNQLPDIYKPNSSSVTKNFTYMLVKNGTVVMSVKTDLRGYTAGQIIKVSTEIENKSEKATSQVVASLMQKVTYHTKKPTHDMRTLAEVEGPPVKGGKKAEWKEQIIVPRLPHSSLAGCNLIELNYYVQVSLKFPEMSLTLPIHIGNIAVDPSKRPPSKPSPPIASPRSSTSAPPASSTPDVPRSSSPGLPPRPAPKPAPRPRPRSTYVTPSAPPAEPDMLGAETPKTDGFPTNTQSQQHNVAPEVTPSPNAFSYAPGLTFPQSQTNRNASAPLFGGATAPTAPVSANGPLSPPPDYSRSRYPHEPPPSYDASFHGT